METSLDESGPQTVIQSAHRAEIDAENVAIQSAEAAEIHAHCVEEVKAEHATVVGAIENLTLAPVIGEVGTVIQHAECARVATQDAMIVAQEAEVHTAGETHITAETVVVHPVPQGPTKDEIREFERIFVEKVKERTAKQTCGGVTDNFKRRNLVEPIEEFTPQLRVTEFYEGGIVKKFLLMLKGHPKQYVKESKCVLSGAKNREVDDISCLEEFLCVHPRSRKRALVGQAGSGKTTLMKRIARDIVSGSMQSSTKNAKAFSKVNFAHYLNIRDIPVTEKDTISPRDLLFGKVMPGVDEKVIEYGFKWLIKNQEKAVLVLDGLDQASWSLSGRYNKIKYFDESDTSTIMYNILANNLFSDASIILSSREHAVARLSGDLRPDIVACLAGFALDDRRKLFIQLAGEDGQRLWDLMCRQSPALIPICSIPLFLFFVVIVYKSHPDNPPDTLSGIILNTLQIFMRCDHAHEREHILDIINKLKKLSYKGTKNGKVLFTIKDLKVFGLLPEVVRDLVVLVPGTTIFSQCLMEGDYRLFFCHQSIQEMLTALYIAEMEPEKFEKFTSKDLHEEHWSVVRRFLCGLLLNEKTHADAERDLLQVDDVEPTTQTRKPVGEPSAVLSEVCNLDVSGSKMTFMDYFAFGSFIRGCGCGLCDVVMQKCDVRGDGMGRFQKGVADAKISKLDVSYNTRIGAAGFLALGEVIETCGVREVVMRECGIKAKEMELFWRSVVDGAKIFKLDASLNSNLGATGFVALGDVIRSCDVTEVILQGCRIKENEMKSFERSVAGAKISKLCVDGPSTMGVGGFAALGGVVKECRVSEVEMRDIKSDEIRSFLKSAAGVQLKMLNLSLSGGEELIDLDGETFDAVAEVVKQCKVEAIVMKGYRFTQEQKQLLKDSVDYTFKLVL